MALYNSVKRALKEAELDMEAFRGKPEYDHWYGVAKATLDGAGK